jgi:Chaperone of endosialidase
MASDASFIDVDSVFDSELTDESGQPNLIINSSKGQKLIWTLKNNQVQELVITRFDSGRVDPTQYHFKFGFTPGALTNTPALPGWNVFAERDEKGGIKFLYVAYEASQTLKLQPTDENVATFTYTSAIQEDANNSKIRVSLSTGNNVTVGGVPIPNKMILLTDLNLVRDTSLSAPPIAVDFVGRRTVLNDGQTGNNFTFALTNMTQADLLLKPNSTIFTVWFDAAPNEGQGYSWALARIQDLDSQDFDLPPPSGDWNISKSVSTMKDLVISPRWNITLVNPVALRPQDPILFTFKGLKTNLDPGFTRMYLKFENVVNYVPGVLIGELEKTPLLYGLTNGNGLYLSAGVPQGKTPPVPHYDSGLFVQQFGTGASAIFNGGRVGIGTEANAPAAKLHIQDPNQNPDAGSLIIGSGTAGDPTLRLGCQPGYAWIQSHAGKPLVINPIARNVGINVANPGSALSIDGGVAIGKSYAQDKTKIAENNLAVEGKVGIGWTDPGSSLSVDGGVAIGKSYAQKNTTVAENNLAVEGKVSIGSTAPSARLQIGDNALVPKIFNDVTTVGIVQSATDTAGLSLRKFDGNPVLQFCVYDKTGKSTGCNYIQADQTNGDLLIGDTGKMRATTTGVLRFGEGVANKQVDAGKIGYKTFSDGLDIVGAGNADDKVTNRKVRIWDQLQTANLLLTGGAKMTADNNQVFEFGYGVANKDPAAGMIGYKVFSPGLDIVGATSDIQNRQIHLWDEVYVRGRLWLMSGGFWCRLDANNPVPSGSWDWAVYRSSSDARLKKEVKPIESALDKVRKLSGNTYHWSDEAVTRFTKHIDTLQPVEPMNIKLTAEDVTAKREAERARQHEVLGKSQVGVIAQEVEAVLPQAVTIDEDGYKAVNYNHLIALLIEAVKEQDREIEELKTRLSKAQL